MAKVFITGANGFVGKNLIKELEKHNIPFIAGVRNSFTANEVSYGEIQKQKNWAKLLQGADSVVHLAARVHVMNETENDPLKLFREVNVEATLNLAKAAKAVGVKKFIFISSVKVNGEVTTDHAFKADDSPKPEDPYGISKFEAEKALMELHEKDIFDVIIIRPPLIYGPGVKANFEKFFNLVGKGFPLPFGAVNNKRSMVSVFNLSDLIINCLKNPKASGHTFMVSDDYDLSLKELIMKMSEAKNMKAVLIPIPVSLMKLGLSMIGKKDFCVRLFGNLQVDIQNTKNILGWKPPYTFVETLKK